MLHHSAHIKIKPSNTGAGGGGGGAGAGGGGGGGGCLDDNYGLYLKVVFVRVAIDISLGALIATLVWGNISTECQQKMNADSTMHQ